jgi:hypothetical protein
MTAEDLSRHDRPLYFFFLFSFPSFAASSPPPRTADRVTILQFAVCILNLHLHFAKVFTRPTRELQPY